VFLSFLLPFPARGLDASYLWVMYKQITHFTPKEIAFVGSREYFRNPNDFILAGRWDLSAQSQEYAGFSIPTSKELDGYTRYHLPNNLFEAWEAIDPSVDNVMRRILTERCGPLESALYRVFVKATNEHPIEAVLTWCNVPSLSTVAAQFGVRVIHSELGPLRAPCYHWTAYFDYSGVNGNTESRHRFASFDLSRQTEEVPLLSTKELRDLFVIDSALRESRPDPSFEIGLPLQVENDTNIIAFANGWTNDQLIEVASSLYGSDKTLVRRHPGGLRNYPDIRAENDQSANSIEFIQRCARIATVNSSVGLESLLFDRQTFILGDNPCAFAALDRLDQEGATQSPADRLPALNFLLFGYLIPYEFLFDPNYLRWRLSGPSEIQTYRFHLSYMLKRQQSISEGFRLRTMHLDLQDCGLLRYWQMRAHALDLALKRQVAACENRYEKLRIQLAELDGQCTSLGHTLQVTHNSWSWRLTSPLRWIREKLG
jgi:hypothetical protein